MEALPTVDDQCEICVDGPRIYKCPRCSVFTCSLACCKQHKSKVQGGCLHLAILLAPYRLLLSQTQCSGIRDRSQFVSYRNLNETNLRSDYHFLEDVLQTKSRAKRTLAQNCGMRILHTAYTSHC
jgi:hypothetical protein